MNGVSIINITSWVNSNTFKNWNSGEWMRDVPFGLKKTTKKRCWGNHQRTSNSIGDMFNLMICPQCKLLFRIIQMKDLYFFSFLWLQGWKTLLVQKGFFFFCNGCVSLKRVNLLLHENGGWSGCIDGHSRVLPVYPGAFCSRGGGYDRDPEG